MKRKILIAMLILLAVAFTAVAITTVKSTEHKLHLREVQLKNTSNELKLEIEESRLLERKLNDGTIKSQQEIDALKKEIEERKQNEARLETELQAKLHRKEQERIAAEQRKIAPINALTATQTASAASQRPAPVVSGDKYTWLAASGIPESEWGYVDSIVSRESGWKPCAFYPSQNDCSANPASACGLAQSLPCGKQSKYGHWTDPVANLKWQYDYVRGKYGSYAQAVAFWNVNHWY